MKQVIALAIVLSCFAPVLGQSTQGEEVEKKELVDWDVVRDEKLNLHRNVKEMEIEKIETRMARNAVDLDNLRRDEALPVTTRRAEVDLEIDALRKEDLELDLMQINTRLKEGAVPAEDKKMAYARQVEIEKEIDVLKAEDSKLRFEEKEALRKEQMMDMSRTQLKAEVVEMKVERRRLDFLLDQRAHTMDMAEKKEKRERIKELTRTIKQFEARREELRGW